MKTAESTQQIVIAYAEIARPLMRVWLPASSCIGSARTTIEVLRRFDIRAQEIPVSLMFAVPEKNYMRIAGFSKAECKKMKTWASSFRDADPTNQGWNGHLLVVAENRWVIDSSIDQVGNEEYGVPEPAEILVIDTIGHEWSAKRFRMHLGLNLDDGSKATLTYERIRNRDYLDSEAWNDEGLDLLARQIVEEVTRKL